MRFRYRKGYGVHSPFAFNFITQVIYENGAYYNYNKLQNLPQLRYETIKICKFLFRLINYVQPKNVYYKTNKEEITPIFHWVNSAIELDVEGDLDLIYLALGDSVELIESELNNIESRINEDSVLVLYGVAHNREMRRLWGRLINSTKAGVSFDLYDLGVLFFNKNKNKQDYIINF